MKHTILALSIAATLTACGDGSNDDQQIGFVVDPSTVPEFYVEVKDSEGNVQERVAAPEVFVAEANKQLNPTGRYIVEDPSAGESLFIPEVLVNHREAVNAEGNTIVDADGNPKLYAYGELEITAAGDWTYTLHRGNGDSDTPEHPDIKNLVEADPTGATDLTDTFTVRTMDGTQKTFRVTIKGIDEDSVFNGTEHFVSLDGPTADNRSTTVTDANPAEAEFSTLYDHMGMEGTSVDLDALAVSGGQASVDTKYGSITLTVSKPVGAIPAVEADPENGIEAVKGVKAQPAKVSWSYALDHSRQVVKDLYDPNSDSYLYYEDPFLDLDLVPKVEDSFTVLSKGLEGNEQKVTITISGTLLEPAEFDKVPGSTVGEGQDAFMYPAAEVSLNDGLTAGEITVSDPNYQQAAFMPLIDSAEGLNYGSVTVDAAGNWRYNIDFTNPDVLALKYTGEAPSPLVDTITLTTVDGTQTSFDVSILPVMQETAAISNLPTLEDGVSSSQVNQKVTVANGQLTITDTNAWEASFQALDNSPVEYGLFSIDTMGNWTYEADADALDNAINNEGLTLPYNVDITVTALDGTTETLPISIVSTEGKNLAAQVGSNNDADAKWVIDLPSIDNGDGTTSDILKGKASFSLRYPEDSTKDIKVLFHGHKWKGTEYLRTMLAMILKADGTIKLYDASGNGSANTVVLDQKHVKGEVTHFELSWDATADTMANTVNSQGKNAPMLWFRINGEPASGPAEINNGAFPAYTVASLFGKGPKFFSIQTKQTDKLDIDDFKVYSDIAGTQEVFSEGFDSDDLLAGSPITVDYQASKTTANSAASAVAFPSVPNFAAEVGDNNGADAKWVINMPTIDNGDGTTSDLLKGMATFKVRYSENSASNKDAKILFHGHKWKGTEYLRTMLALVLRSNGQIKLYDAASNSSTFVADQTHTKGQFSTFVLTWDATADTMANTVNLHGKNVPKLSLTIDGVPVSGHNEITDGMFPAFTVAGLFGKGPKFFSIQTKGGDKLEIDDFRVFSDVEGTNEIFEENFNSDELLDGSPLTLDYQYADKTTGNSSTTAVELE
ncbi:outer membrane adhesin-like protein [Catenovulum agarivorans DS-2]|uniref:Outer membrane adhesin-like protein n=1 Tax=Catenovulum agarivorans DS-2 TaxID=1328313 RepID=W7QYR4_9ALTE|nr:VCBS domain-containing protein [Catenovulum agarivorans]EWH10530.1 outer membrane adhesin-like protein [Catenovulum agarivorans DS-2]